MNEPIITIAKTPADRDWMSKEPAWIHSGDIPLHTLRLIAEGLLLAQDAYEARIAPSAGGSGTYVQVD
jgi:hypothetical protein